MNRKDTRMEKLLIINEKPSQYQAFSKALGGVDGEFDGYQYHLMHLFGHILGLPVPEMTAKNNAKQLVGSFSNTENTPWHYQWFDFSKRALKDKNFASIIQDVQDYLNQGYIPVIASDIDDSGEGDLLVREVLNYVGYTGKTYREYHDDETEISVRNALRQKALKVVTLEDPAYRKSNARTNMDYLTQQLTRVATKRVVDAGYTLPVKTVKVGRKNKRVMNVVPMGRLKSVILREIGDQEKRIKAYKPSSVFESRYKLGDLVLSAKDMPQFKTKAEWKHDDLPNESTVKEVGQKKGRTLPPKAYSLSQVAGEMAKYGMKGKQVIDLFQKMYEAHYLSYPRSEDNFISPEQFVKATNQLDNVLDLLGLPRAAFTHREPRPQYVHTGSSHGALRYGAVLPNSMQELVDKFGKHADDLWRVVSERFVQMYLEDTEWIKYTYETVDTPKPFTGSVRVVTKQGVIDPDEKEKPSSLPDLRNKAQLYAHELKSTRPQKTTAKWLYKQLEKDGVGTGATRVQTTAAMCGAKNNAPINESRELTLSPLGWVGYRFALITKIGSVEGTKYLAGLIDGVAKGGSYDDAYSEFDNVMAQDVQSLKEGAVELDDTGLEKKEYIEGVWNGQNVRVNRTFAGHRFTDDEVTKLLNGEEIEIEANGKNGPMQLVGKLANLEYNGNPYVGFDARRAGYATGTWNGKTVTIKASYMDHKFTQDELNALFAGQEIQIETHQDDKTYNLTGKLEEQVFNNNGKDIRFVGFKAHFPLKPGHVRVHWQGRDVVIKGSYMDHKFTDDELTKLSNGETINIETHKDDKTYKLEGKLEDQTFTQNGKTYKFVGFKAYFPLKPGYTRGVWRGHDVTFKGSFGDHKFTQAELDELLAGHNIEFAFTTKSGKQMTVHGKLANKTYEGHSFVGFEPEFDKK